MNSSIKKIIKIIGFAILGIVILIIGSIAYLWYSEELRPQEEDKVVVAVEYKLDTCTKEKPLAVVISNKSDKTINYVSFGIEIRRKGYSSDISGWSSRHYNTDKIIEPEEAYIACWGYDMLEPEYQKKYNNPENLEFEVYVNYIIFR